MSETPNRPPAQALPPLLDVRDLTFRIPSRTLWAGLDFALHAGDSLAITGPSGSGKTLLLRTLAGLEPMASGEIRLDDKPSNQWFMPAYRARIVYVRQHPAFRDGTVQDAIEGPFRLRVRRGESVPMEAVLDHLKFLGRSHTFLEQSTEHLSGGELQIVALLRAIAVNPTILMLDEPTASLDPDTVDCVESLVKRWFRVGERRANIWTSHDAAQLARVCNRSISIGGTNET